MLRTYLRPIEAIGLCGGLEDHSYQTETNFDGFQAMALRTMVEMLRRVQMKGHLVVMLLFAVIGMLLVYYVFLLPVLARTIAQTPQPSKVCSVPNAYGDARFGLAPIGGVVAGGAVGFVDTNGTVRIVDPFTCSVVRTITRQ